MPAPASVHYRRDLLGRLVAAGTVDDPKAHGAWSWRGDGALVTETLKAVTRRFAHDGLGRPASIDEPAMTLGLSYRMGGDPAKPDANGGIAAETVTYKPAAFPAGAAPPSSTTTYAYDAFDRLTTASSQRAAQTVTAAYDANGNLDSLAQAGTSRSYVYTAGTSRLVSVTGQAYAHDAAGGVTSAAGTTLVRDPATGRMRRGSRATQTVSVLRDARGRIALTVQDTAKRLTLRGGSGPVLWEREGTAAFAHVHGATGRIGLWTGDQLYAVSKDLRGSTRILYGGDGKAAAWLSYCAYGAADIGASSTGTLTGAIRNRYTGQDWLETLALYDYGARLYDPALGRFLSPDPADETPSPYMYVAGNPVNGVDPDGRVINEIIKFRGLIFFRSKQGIVAVTREGANIHQFLKRLNSKYSSTYMETTGKPYSVYVGKRKLKGNELNDYVARIQESSLKPSLYKFELYTKMDNSPWLDLFDGHKYISSILGPNDIRARVNKIVSPLAEKVSLPAPKKVSLPPPNTNVRPRATSAMPKFSTMRREISESDFSMGVTSKRSSMDSDWTVFSEANYLRREDTLQSLTDDTTTFVASEKSSRRPSLSLLSSDFSASRRSSLSSLSSSGPEPPSSEK